MAALGFMVGFLLCWRPSRNAILLFALYVWFRSDPLDFLLWISGGGACMLAWWLLTTAPGEAPADKPGS